MSISDVPVDRTAGSGSISNAVVSAVAEATGTDPTEMDPLYNVVDPDALESLFQSAGPASVPSSRRVEFEYWGCEVVVTADRTVRVWTAENEDRSRPE